MKAASTEAGDQVGSDDVVAGPHSSVKRETSATPSKTPAATNTPMTFPTTGYQFSLPKALPRHSPVVPVSQMYLPSPSKASPAFSFFDPNAIETPMLDRHLLDEAGLKDLGAFTPF